MKRISISDALVRTHETSENIKAITAKFSDPTSSVYKTYQKKCTYETFVVLRHALILNIWCSKHKVPFDLIKFIYQVYFEQELEVIKQDAFFVIANKNHLNWTIQTEIRHACWALINSATPERKITHLGNALGMEWDTEDALNIMFRRRLTNLFLIENWIKFQRRLVNCTCDTCSGTWNTIWARYSKCTCECPLCNNPKNEKYFRDCDALSQSEC